MQFDKIIKAFCQVRSLVQQLQFAGLQSFWRVLSAESRAPPPRPRPHRSPLPPSLPASPAALPARQKKAVDHTHVRFVYDGTRVQPDMTPDDLDMEDGDTIDAFLEQVGGGGHGRGSARC